MAAEVFLQNVEPQSKEYSFKADGNNSQIRISTKHTGAQAHHKHAHSLTLLFFLLFFFFFFLAVFSYGMLLYELITLKRPYEEIEMPVINIFDEVEKGVPPRVQACDMNSMYSPLIALHRNCVQKIPEERPTLEKVRDDLQALTQAAVAASTGAGASTEKF
jgi:serine/threonine protein kinase